MSKIYSDAWMADQGFLDSKSEPVELKVQHIK
jgi:hypothetical protein